MRRFPKRVVPKLTPSGVLARLKRLFGGGAVDAPAPDAAPSPVLQAPTREEPALPEPSRAVEETATIREPSGPVDEAPVEEPLVDEAPVEEPLADRPEEVHIKPAPLTPVLGSAIRFVSELAVAHTFEVTTAGATIGRGPDNSVRLSDLSVSRRHARVVYRQGAYWLSDVGSMGGTWIDGTKLAAARRLEPGQVIDIGVCRFTVAGPPSASSEDDRPMRRPATSTRTRRQ